MAHYKHLPLPTRLVREAHERHLRRIREIEATADREQITKRAADDLLARTAPYRHHTGKTLIGPEDI